MANSKVKFHALERLDLIDINGLQDLIHDALLSHTGQLVGGNGWHCCLEKWDTLTVDNVNHALTFGNFTFLGQMYDPTTSAGYAGYIGRFNSTLSGNSDCSFDAARASVQTYVNANGELPPAVSDDAFSNVSHGQYYPNLFIVPVESDSDPGPRRFWSLAGGTETTTEVNTRTEHACTWTVSADFSLPSQLSGVYGITKVARITKWTLTAGVVSLDADDVTPFGLADTLLDPTGTGAMWDFRFANSTNIGGISHAMYILRQKILDLTFRGTNDPGLTSSTGIEDKPLMSLNGMYKDFGDRITVLENEGTARATATIFRTLDINANADNFFVYNASENDFSLGAVADWSTQIDTIYDEIGNAIAGGQTPPADLASINDGKRGWHFFWTFGLVIPDEFQGRNIQVNITPLYMGDNQENARGSGGGSTLIRSISEGELTRGSQWGISLPGVNSDYSDKITMAGLLNNVSAIQARNPDGDLYADTYGMVFRNDVLHTESLTGEQVGAAIYLQSQVQWCIKVDVTLLP
jgi:hypothetical protein